MFFATKLAPSTPCLLPCNLYKFHLAQLISSGLNSFHELLVISNLSINYLRLTNYRRKSIKMSDENRLGSSPKFYSLRYLKRKEREDEHVPFGSIENKSSFAEIAARQPKRFNKGPHEFQFTIRDLRVELIRLIYGHLDLNDQENFSKVFKNISPFEWNYAEGLPKGDFIKVILERRKKKNIEERKRWPRNTPWNEFLQDLRRKRIEEAEKFKAAFPGRKLDELFYIPNKTKQEKINKTSMLHW